MEEGDRARMESRRRMAFDQLRVLQRRTSSARSEDMVAAASGDRSPAAGVVGKRTNQQAVEVGRICDLGLCCSASLLTCSPFTRRSLAFSGFLLRLFCSAFSFAAAISFCV